VSVILAPGLDIDKLHFMRTLRRLPVALDLPAAFGPDGLDVRMFSDGRCVGSVIVTQASHDGIEWIHASIAWTERLPTYAELALLGLAVFGRERYAYQVFAPASRHVNIHEHALHLWGRADGVNVLPDFGRDGTI
jgi:hypothetical protein